MREIVKDWRKDWIEANGETNEFEVEIRNSSETVIYGGSFAEIPEELWIQKVKEHGKIMDSSVPNRIGAYVLTIT